MQVTRKSRLTGITRTMELPITEDQLIDYSRGALIQDALWNLTPAEREFFMTGIVDEEWNETFKDLEEDGKRGHQGC